ncbi:PREDICTED: rhotekin [Haliaeetus leucocephalus]|uniref:rhotekin n=1 Tax=Haliaeetus leucocephalus TaxID=52644 RepID=UPI00053CCC1E|nr:PREDICTED: rhotekin [Haliaeetus leucocephalus]
MQEKLRILEDLNMLYIRQIAISLQAATEGPSSVPMGPSRGGSAPLTTHLPHPPPTPDLRIPLMWKDTEYFRNKGELHRCAVFCLLQLGAEIHDTPMVLVDRTLTDICFESAPALTIAVNKETRIRATEREGRGQPHGMAVTNRYGGEEVTHTLLAESRAEAQRWMEAFWQHFYDMSQWKQCCDELMRIEVPPPRRPPAMLPRQGSLYHEMAIDPADDIEAVTDILTRRAGGRAPGTPPWVSLFEGPPPHAPHSGRAGSPSPPARRPWGRPRTLSLDAKLSTLKGRGSRQAAHPPRPSPPSSGSSSSGSSSPVMDHNPPTPPSPLQSRV